MPRPTKAQLWARGRNGTKFYVKGIQGNLSRILRVAHLTTTERTQLQSALAKISNVLGPSWEVNNPINKITILGESK